MPSGSRRQPRTSGPRLNRGFTYLWLLAALAVVSVGLAAVGERWADRSRREHEADLLRIGTLYASAIARYRDASPGALKTYPRQLEDLLEDARIVGRTRYLRKLYADPTDPSRGWGLVRAPDGGVLGVFSQSDAAPLHASPLDIGVAVLPAASRYSDWKFAPRAQP